MIVEATLTLRSDGRQVMRILISRSHHFAAQRRLNRVRNINATMDLSSLDSSKNVKYIEQSILI